MNRKFPRNRNMVIFIFFFFLSVGFLSVPNDIVAAEQKVTSGTRLATLSKVGSPINLNIYGIQASVPIMQLNGVLAMCLDIDLHANFAKNAYQYSGVVTDSNLKNLFQAGLDARSKGRNTEYIASQVAMWGYQRGKSENEIGQAIADVLNKYGYTQGGKDSFSASDGVNYYRSIKNSGNGSNLALYLYTSICDGEYQSFITTTLAMPCEGEECNQTCQGGTPYTCEIVNGKYYGKNGKEVTQSEYQAQCSGSNCPTALQTGGGTCSNTALSDPDWSCIAGNSNYLDTTHNDPGNNNPYCSFYCRETLESAFPYQEETFEAGQYFTVGYGLRNVWGPVEFSGTRECRSYYKSGSKWVEGINTQKFINDYNAIVAEIPKYYTEWQNELRHQAAANSASYNDNDANCPIYDRKFTNSLCTTTNGICYGTNSKGQKYTYSACPSGYQWGSYGCYKDVVGSYGRYYYSKSYIKYDIYGNSSTAYTKSGCSQDTSANPGYYQTQYNNAVNRAQTYLNYIRQCEAMNTPYQLNPVVNFSYNIGSSYDWSGELKSSYESSESAPAINGAATSNKNNSVYGNSSGCSGTNCSVVAYSCSGAYCSARTSLRENIYNVNVSTKRTITYKTASYSLPDNLYKYTDKINGKAYKTLPSNIKDSVSYIDLSESTLPIDIYISPGKYDLSLSYSKLGNIVNGSAHFDRLVQNLDNDYKCPIQIDNTLIVPECKENPNSSSCSNPSGIDVIYRTIKLGSQDVAFPSIDGDGRTPGANWNSEDGSIVSKYITNNRNVQGEEVYTLTPLYKITLTPTIIKQIRTYNKAVNDYGDFNLSCEIDSSGKATGRKCISNFIHNTVSANGASYNFSAYFDSSATCQNITTGTFYSCADK